jgi:hypothetical protein
MSDVAKNKFWDNFSKKIWEKRSVVVRNFESEVSAIKEQQVFQMLVSYSSHCRKIKNSTGFKFYIDGQLQYHEDIFQFLPKAQDQNFSGYNSRMEEIFSDYCLVCDELLLTSQNEFQKLKAFTNELFKHIGLPNRFSEIGLYVGNYRKTPFGVHVDGCGVFSFPVVGKKSFRIWSAYFARKNPTLNRAHKYEKFKKNSQLLKTQVGDMAYWPSSAWHIAESDGSFSATWSLGVWVDQTHQQTIEESLKPLLKKKLGRGGLVSSTVEVGSDKNGQIKNLPKNYLDSISVLRKLSENEIYDALMTDWVLHKSKMGFKNLPQDKNILKITLKSRIQLQDQIFWAKLKIGNQIVFGYRGNIILSSSAGMMQLVKDLNLGKSCLVSGYLVGGSFRLFKNLILK